MVSILVLCRVGMQHTLEFAYDVTCTKYKRQGQVCSGWWSTPTRASAPQHCFASIYFLPKCAVCCQCAIQEGVNLYCMACCLSSILVITHTGLIFRQRCWLVLCQRMVHPSTLSAPHATQWNRWLRLLRTTDCLRHHWCLFCPSLRVFAFVGQTFCTPFAHTTINVYNICVPSILHHHVNAHEWPRLLPF